MTSERKGEYGILNQQGETPEYDVMDRITINGL